MPLIPFPFPETSEVEVGPDAFHVVELLLSVLKKNQSMKLQGCKLHRHKPKWHFLPPV